VLYGCWSFKDLAKMQGVDVDVDGWWGSRSKESLLMGRRGSHRKSRRGEVNIPPLKALKTRLR